MEDEYEYDDEEQDLDDEDEDDEGLFEGSYSDGPNIDLFDWCGLELSDDERSLVWEQYSPHALIERCPSLEVEIDEAADDAGPDLNDTYYTVYGDAAEAKRELREEILAILGKTEEDLETDE